MRTYQRQDSTDYFTLCVSHSTFFHFTPLLSAFSFACPMEFSPYWQDLLWRIPLGSIELIFLPASWHPSFLFIHHRPYALYPLPFLYYTFVIGIPLSTLKLNAHKLLFYTNKHLFFKYVKFQFNFNMIQPSPETKIYMKKIT